MRAPSPPPKTLTAVSAFQRRASAHLLQRPGPTTMSLANPSRIESMSGERQGWPFGLSLAARLDQSAAARAAILQTSRTSGWKAAPASHPLQTSQGFFRRAFEGYSVDIVLIIVRYCRSSRSLLYEA